MTVRAFVDESIRGQRYIMCAAVVDPAQLNPLRKTLRELLLPGQRELHFKWEKPRRRRLIADRIAELDASVRVYVATSHRRDHETARRRCLDLIVRDLLPLKARRLVLDSRGHRDSIDDLALRNSLGQRPSLTNFTYEHHDSASECLLWIPDAVAWCYGAGGDWKRRVEPILAAIVDA